MCIVLLAVGLWGAAARGQYALPENVCVLVNSASSESVEVGEFYRVARNIPESNVCALEMPVEYGITLAEYKQQVRQPLAACLLERDMEDRILFIAVTFGVPAVITDVGEPVLGLTTKSLDSFLVDLFDQMPAAQNFYYLSDQAFLRENGYLGYLVTRLDGPSFEVALDLVDRAQNAGFQGVDSSGTAYLDQEPSGDSIVDRQVIAGAGEFGNGQIVDAEVILAAQGWPTVMDTHDAEFGTDPALLICPEARWYLGWYKAFHYNDAFEWTAGAAGIHMDSFSAMNFREPGSWCAGALLAGVTATAGAVWEPYVSDFIRGDLFLEGLAVLGLSLAEAAYRAIPRNEWMMVVFGDPLFSLEREYPALPDSGDEDSPETADFTTEDAGTPGPEAGAELEFDAAGALPSEDICPCKYGTSQPGASGSSGCSTVPTSHGPSSFSGADALLLLLAAIGLLLSVRAQHS